MYAKEYLNELGDYKNIEYVFVYEWSTKNHAQMNIPNAPHPEYITTGEALGFGECNQDLPIFDFLAKRSTFDVDVFELSDEEDDYLSEWPTPIIDIDNINENAPKTVAYIVLPEGCERDWEDFTERKEEAENAPETAKEKAAKFVDAFFENGDFEPGEYGELLRAKDSVFATELYRAIENAFERFVYFDYEKNIDAQTLNCAIFELIHREEEKDD